MTRATDVVIWCVLNGFHPSYPHVRAVKHVTYKWVSR